MIRIHTLLLQIFCLMMLISCQSNSKANKIDEKAFTQKIGQMLILGFDGKRVSTASDNPIVAEIQQGLVGGVILFDYDYQQKVFDKNIESPEQVKALINQLQAYASAAPTQTQPLFIAVDYEGGKLNRLKAKYGFPETLSAQTLAGLSDELVYHYAKQMAETLKQVGFNLDFAPVTDLNSNPHNPVIGALERSFGEDPEAVTFYATMFAKAFAERDIACAYKHFPGHGSSTTDSHKGFVDVTDTWQQNELVPYTLSFQSEYHCPFVMTAHIVNRQLDPAGHPATLSHAILTSLLRQQLQFNGLIITDDMQMQAITDNYSLEEAVVKAINAGVDMLIFGNQLVAKRQSAQEIIDIVLANLKSGQISPERIDAAYQRITDYKQKQNKALAIR